MENSLKCLILIVFFGNILLYIMIGFAFDRLVSTLNWISKFKPSSPRIPSIVVYFRPFSVNCSHSYKPENISILKDGTWQKVSDSNMYIFSSYIDKRLEDKTHIRFIAMADDSLDKRYFCRIFLKSGYLVTEAEYQELWSPMWEYSKPWNYFKPFLLTCSIEKTAVLTAASVVNQPCERPTNIFWFTNTSRLRPAKFAVCLKPLNFNNDMTMRVIEWMELQFLLGADKITVYQYAHVQHNTILRLYECMGKVDLIKYSLPGIKKEPEDSSHRLWQKRRHEMAIYNDCFYRHIHSHQFVINLDLDEAILPRQDITWEELLDHMNASTLRSASISASNVYFFDTFTQANLTPELERSHMLSHIIRSLNFTPPGFAQKSFFPTKYALSVSNHYALSALRTGVKINTRIPKHIAQLNHYRKTCPDMMENDCRNVYMKYRTKDNIILKYKKSLLKNVRKRIEEFNLTKTGMPAS